MKKRFPKLLALALCAVLLLGCSSCGMFKSIRESARLAREREIMETPAEADLASVYNEALQGSRQKAEKLTEKISYSVGRPSVESENGDVGILSAAADTLKKMIMESAPGSSERELAPGEIADTLLKELAGAEISSMTGSRNEAMENQTDENGKEITDEEGNVVTAPVTLDNILRTEFRFYTEEKKTETDENGNEKETVTLHPADAAVIEKYFGAPADKAAVLAGFDSVKDYLQVNDYTVEYKDCRINATGDMENSELESVSFVKKMTVTADVTGAGAFAHLGNFTVTLDVSKTTEYSFTFRVAAE